MAAHPNMPAELDELRSLFDAVDSDNPTNADIRAFRAALKEYPKMWRALGDMTHNAATHLVDTLGAPESLKLSLLHSWHELQEELGAADSTPLEQLLIQQVVLSWMRLGIVDYAYTDVVNGSASYKSLDYWEKRLNASQRRFLRACETLARIRKIDPQIIQLNIAEKQVNLAG